VTLLQAFSFGAACPVFKCQAADKACVFRQPLAEADERCYAWQLTTAFKPVKR
jgi:hypothetical protein